VSERTIDKDLELVRHGLGYELARTATGYVFMREPAIQSLQLSTAEALALVLAAQQSLQTGTTDRSALASALTRLEDALPPQVAQHARQAVNDTRGSIERPAKDRSSILHMLMRAQISGRKVVVRYTSTSRKNAETTRTIAPYSIAPHLWSWFVVAHDSYREAVIVFNVDRIRSCVLTDERYSVPGDFDLSAYWGSSWGVMRGAAAEAVDVSLRFQPEARTWVEEMQWHPSQRTEALEDGGVRVRFHCGVTDEMVRWLLWYGSSVVVEQPASLREQVVGEAEATISGNGEYAESE
jgi:predicted DNA-binding transcriptional regulator YafY